MDTEAKASEARGGQLPKLQIFKRRGLMVCVGTTAGTIGTQAQAIIASVTPKCLPVSITS